MKFEVKNRRLARFVLRATYIAIHLFSGVALILLLFDNLKSPDDNYTISSMNTIFYTIFTTIWCSWGWDRMKLIRFDTHTIDILYEFCTTTLTWVSILLVSGGFAFEMVSQSYDISISWERARYGPMKENLVIALVTLAIAQSVRLGIPVKAGLKEIKE